MNSRGPLGQKVGKSKPNPRYIAAIHELPCCVCEAFGEFQLSPTTAHHVIHGRYSQRKTPDEMAIPLCDGHHQGSFDGSKVAIHQSPQEWARLYGEDRSYSAQTQAKLKHILRG